MEWIIFTESDMPWLDEMNGGTELKVRPRRIDQPAGALFGAYAATTRIVQGEYQAYWGNLLAEFPRVYAEPDELFILDE